MSTSTLIVADPSNTKVLNLWNGSSNNTPPTNWWAETFDDSGWETPVLVTPDPSETYLPFTEANGLVPMWSSTDSPSTRAIILTRTHFTLPTVITDPYGVQLGPTDFFNGTVQAPDGSFVSIGEISPLADLDPSSISGYIVEDWYNGIAGLPFHQSPSGPCVIQRDVSNLHLGADNVFAFAINLGIQNCAVSTPYGPWNAQLRSGLPQWFALGFRFYIELCSSTNYWFQPVDLATMTVKAQRFTGSADALFPGWHAADYDDSGWPDAVEADTGTLTFTDRQLRWEDRPNFTGDTLHQNALNEIYNPAGNFAAGATLPPAYWAISNESDAGVSVILRVHFTPYGINELIRRAQLYHPVVVTVVYDGTVLALDYAGFTNPVMYLNGNANASLKSVFPSLLHETGENVLTLLMTTDSTSLANGWGAWIELMPQLANCGPFGPVIDPTTIRGTRSFGQFVG